MTKTIATRPDFAARMALFLLEKEGSIFARWGGRLTTTEQRELFGRYIGKGKIWICGEDETVEHWATVCFGTMRECNRRFAWRDLV